MRDIFQHASGPLGKRFAAKEATPAEGAVLRALRWLKKHQEADGCWRLESGGGNPQVGAAPAMTGLALLAFLAHGDTPAGEEFGATVKSAIRWLVEKQDATGHFAGRDPHDYSHPIATYALAEADSSEAAEMLDVARAEIEALNRELAEAHSRRMVLEHIRSGTIRRLEKVSDELAVIQSALDRINALFEDAASDDSGGG